MATIKEGYNGVPLEIRVHGNEGRGTAEVWTEMYCEPHEGEIDDYREERLHYATITELIDLRDEINEAIKELAGV